MHKRNVPTWADQYIRLYFLWDPALGTPCNEKLIWGQHIHEYVTICNPFTASGQYLIIIVWLGNARGDKFSLWVGCQNTPTGYFDNRDRKVSTKTTVTKFFSLIFGLPTLICYPLATRLVKQVFPAVKLLLTLRAPFCTALWCTH